MAALSRRWRSQNQASDTQRHTLNLTRRKLCPRSPFLPEDFDLVKHRAEWAAGKEREAAYKRSQKGASRHHPSTFTLPPSARPKSPFPTSPSHPPTSTLRQPFNGTHHTFTTSRSPVLLVETIFSPQSLHTTPTLAPWPSKSEMQYEGDDRVKTDRLHGRFPGAPRVAGNETVNWQHKAILQPFPFDDFLFPIPNEVEVFMRTHWIKELEIRDEEGVRVLGTELMGLLDPKDQFLE